MLAILVIYISNGVDSGNGIACISGRVIKSASGGSIVNVVGSVGDCFLVLVVIRVVREVLVNGTVVVVVVVAGGSSSSAYSIFQV